MLSPFAVQLNAATAGLHRLRKMRIYARESVPHVWLVNPIARTLEAYRLKAGRWTLDATHGGDDVARIAPFEAIELELARLWTD